MNPSEGRITLDVLRTIPELEELTEFWTSQHTNRDGDLDHYLFTIESRSEIVRPHVLILCRDRTPQKLLIGRLEEKRLPMRFGYARLQTGKIRSLSFIEGGTLRDLSDQEGELVVASIMASLRAGEADVAMFDGVDLDHPLYGQALSAPGWLCTDHFPEARLHWTRRPRPAGEPFIKSLSANERYNHRRRTKRLLQDFQGKVRIDCFHDGSDVDRLMEDAEAVAKTSYQRGLGVGFVKDRTMRQRLELDVGKGSLRAHILYAGERPCAFWIGSLYRGVFYNDYMAFDPAYAKYAPGMYLAVNVIEEMERQSADGATPGIDFGFGEAAWKARFGDHCAEEAALHICAPTIKGIATNTFRTAVTAANHSAKAVLRRAGLFAKIRRGWRDRMSQKSRDNATA